MEADKSFAALKEQFEKRSKEMQGRARTDLSMQFGEQQFEERSKEMQGRARKPLEGLVKEEKMAQDIYKAKIAELRQSIKDGVKQDMTDRGVNEKPNLDNPNEVGKPMTAEGTKKIRKDMKDLKQYKQLVKE
jgi:sugar-specific transcriptional regulator TrmB